MNRVDPEGMMLAAVSDDRHALDGLESLSAVVVGADTPSGRILAASCLGVDRTSATYGGTTYLLPVAMLVGGGEEAFDNPNGLVRQAPPGPMTRRQTLDHILLRARQRIMARTTRY